MDKKIKKTKAPETSPFPPVIAVLGHVDHGKTTLLDAIRKTNIAQKEHGGITQKIGASKIEIIHDNVKREITFIDTPGHEAFSKMRSRGTQAADICLLIVSSTDGVMPQTKESIKILKEAKIPYIVVLTKIDLPENDIQKTKGGLLKEEVMLEGMGGDIPVSLVSAKTGKGVKELLELCLLVYDMHPLERKENARLDSARLEFIEAIVIESKLDPRVGPKATIVVKNGKVSLKDELVCENIKAKVKALINDKGQNVNEAGIGEAVEVLGFEEVPPVGGIISKKGVIPVQKDALAIRPEVSLEQKEDTLSIILCADSQGSLEAILNSLPSEIHVLSFKTGDISTNDVLLAKSTGSIILGFNVKEKPEITNLAQTERVIIKTYNLIYKLLEEIIEVAKGVIKLEDEVLGTGKIMASFPFEKTTVLGIKVMEGRIARGDKAKIVRDEAVLGEATITSVRQGKNPISKVEKGNEAGIILSPFLDFAIGDMVISHR